jgi:hypothetical protein
MENTISFTENLDGVDWESLKARLLEDKFDNGRTPEELCRSFTNSASVCFARAEGKVIGKARLLSDGICNAYLVDVWTYTPYRNRGIAREMLRRLEQSVPGQHIYLQADDDVTDLYKKLGYTPQPHGLNKVVGKWLDQNCEQRPD